MISVRKQEENCFMRAFKTYMVPFMKTAKERKVIIRKDKSGTAFFEFTEENGVITTRRFPDDLIFAYKIAVDAIYDSTKPSPMETEKTTKTNMPEYTIQAYEDFAVVALN